MKEEKISMRRRAFTRGISMLFAVVLAFALIGCAEPKNEVPESVRSITVKVNDLTDEKVIGPSGVSGDVSHYVITVMNEDEGISQSSGFLMRGEEYSVTNVPAGLWSARVDAYVKTADTGADSDYMLVASAETAGATRVDAGGSAILTVTLDVLRDDPAGDILLTLKMPAELDDEGDVFSYTYSVSGLGQRGSYLYEEDVPQKGTVGAAGRSATLTIDTSAFSPAFYQGSYIFTITIFEGADEASSNVVRKGVEVLRMVGNLDSEGEIDLDSQVILEDGFTLSVVDRIGDRLDFESASYEDFSSDMTITLGYGDIPVSVPVDVYVDGIMLQQGSDYSTEVSASGDSVSYEFASFDKGRHVVTFIIDEADTELGVGSLSIEIAFPYEIGFTPVLPDDVDESL